MALSACTELDIHPQLLLVAAALGLAGRTPQQMADRRCQVAMAQWGMPVAASCCLLVEAEILSRQKVTLEAAVLDAQAVRVAREVFSRAAAAVSRRVVRAALVDLVAAVAALKSARAALAGMVA